MVLRTSRSVVPLMLLVGLVVSIGLNVHLLYKPPTVIGIADSKQIGEGTDQRGDPLTWYTVSVALVTEDRKNDLQVGATMAYIIDEEDFERIRNGTVVKGRPGDDLRLDNLVLTYSELSETTHGLFFRQKGSR